MSYNETRHDAPVSGDDMQKPQDSKNDDKSDKPSEKGEFKFSDWASI